MGLSTVYGIVKQSWGHIWVYSEPGQGTTFKTYFPRVEADYKPVVFGKAKDTARAGSETILLVEDDDGLRGFAQKALQKYGYKVLAARDSEEAMVISNQCQGPVHLLLTDTVMPGLSGPALAQNLTQLRGDMKVLYMSGYTDDVILRHGLLEAGLAFLQKPFGPDALAHKVREVLDVDWNKDVNE